MKILHNFFIGMLAFIGMAGLATADLEKQVNKAKEHLLYGRLNKAAQKLIEIHSEVCNHMYETIQRFSPNSGILINQKNCNIPVQYRGNTFEGPIIISAWAENSLCRLPGIPFEYAQIQMGQQGGEVVYNYFKFYNEDNSDRYYGICCDCYFGDNKKDMEKALIKFVTKKIGKSSLQECARWWNENFCRTAVNLLAAYIQKFNLYPANFTLTDTYYFLMAYKVYVESDGGSCGLLLFSQENFEETRRAVHKTLANLLLCPGMNLFQPKLFVLNALSQWGTMVYEKVDQYHGLEVHPIGYYQIEIDLLYGEIETQYLKYEDTYLLCFVRRTMKGVHANWAVEHQAVIKKWTQLERVK